MEIKKFQAKHIPDFSFLLTIAALSKAKRYEGAWVLVRDLERVMPHIPRKVIIAKAGQLIKRNLLDGCDCGCRGDFELTNQGISYLALMRGNE